MSGHSKWATIKRKKAATDAASASGAYLVGGLLSHRCASPLLAMTAGEDAGGSEGIAGLMLAPGVAVATGLTQGCVPVGPVHRVDEARFGSGQIW